MMRKIIFFILIIALLLPVIPAMAISPADEQYINQIVGGGFSSLRRASQSIHRTGVTERQVLDVLSEKLLQTYNASDRTGVDAVAWACKALGQSGDLRYKSVLQTVTKTAQHAKIRKYANQSLKGMPSGEAQKPYEKGSVNLKALRAKLDKGQSPVPASKKSQGKQVSGEKRYSLSSIRKGMSIQEVNSLLGPPTSNTSHITGKSFNPFYYGSDTARQIYLYKGQGRIFFSNKRYSNAWRVIEIEINPGETGYP
jgi:hypothetical protein